MAKKGNAKNVPSTGILLVAGVLVFVMSGWLWWVKVYQDPTRVFEKMLDNNLKTQSVTRSAKQESENGSIDQRLQLSFGTKPGVRALTTIQQASSFGENKVTTETIGSLDSDYVRYANISTSQKKADGKDLDFGGIVGVWAKQPPPSDGTQSQFFHEAMLNVAIFGNLPGNQRPAVIKFLKNNLYQVDYKNVRRTKQNGRSTFEYDVTIKPENFISFFKSYGKLTGISSLSELEHEDYKNTNQLQLVMSVDTLSRQLISVQHKDSKLTETYSSYGLLADITPPTSALGVDEIQKRLSELE